MVASRAGSSIGLAFLLATVASTAARGQDAAPDELTPQAVLKSHNLDRASTFWVLTAAEKTVLKDLADARALHQQVYQGMMRQQELEYEAQNRQETLLQLRERSAILDQSIAEYNAQINALPGGNNLVQQQKNMLSQQRDMLVTAHNQVVNQLNTLQEQQNKDQGQDLKLQLSAEVAQSREKYMQEVVDLRKSVDTLTAKYGELSKNPEVTKALEALSASTKNKQKLGPSAKIRDAIKLLEKAEGSVQSDNIELHREGGVDHVYASLGKAKVSTKMVFDTGASITTISAKLAGRIGLKSKPGDPPIRLTTADGTVVEAKRVVIPLVRVGKFTVPNVECAVMPAEKGDVDPLLGQTFFKHFKVEYSAEARKLSLKKLDTDGDETKSMADADAKPSTKATTKGKRTVRPPRTTAKSKRANQSRPSLDGGDAQTPPAEGKAEPN